MACVRRHANLGFLRDQLPAIRESVVKTTVTSVSKQQMESLKRLKKPSKVATGNGRADKKQQKNNKKDPPASRSILNFFTAKNTETEAQEQSHTEADKDAVGDDNVPDKGNDNDNDEGAAMDVLDDGEEDDDIVDDDDLDYEENDDIEEDGELADIVVDEEHEKDLDEPEIEEQELDDFADDSI